MNRRIILFLTLIALAAVTSAQPKLKDLDISVVLCKNGDARITETRQMTVTSEGTECYIKLNNTGNSIVKDLTVTDEQGTQFETQEFWNTDWSRAEKTNKCGIMMPANGYELCWGLGADGERTYTTSYRLTNLVEGYTDSDGFNWMFVARDLTPYPEHVRLTITAEDGTLLNDSIANIWAFGYGGDILFRDSAIVAETTEPFKEHDGMIVMCEFIKGVFTPDKSHDQSFQEVKQRAFEGSDYLEEDKDPLWMQALYWISGGGMIFLALCGLLWEPVERMVNKYKFRNVDWYRDIPLGGDLVTANHLMNKWQQTLDYDKLLTACVLKLVQIGALGIENLHKRPAFTIKSWPEDAQLVNHELLQSIHDIFQKAAGYDQVLNPHELTNYMEKEENYSDVLHFLHVLHKGYISKLSDYKTEVRQMLGLKKYLEDFTLIDEREVREVALWKDYMVWATLFDSASTVVKQMKKINPEYFKMDDIASLLAFSVIEPEVTKEFAKATGSAYYKYIVHSGSSSNGRSRRSGSGGRASRGGGGGHRGGGSGGGIR